jgi:hypothetical protein
VFSNVFTVDTHCSVTLTLIRIVGVRLTPDPKTYIAKLGAAANAAKDDLLRVLAAPSADLMCTTQHNSRHGQNQKQ